MFLLINILFNVIYGLFFEFDMKILLVCIKNSFEDFFDIENCLLVDRNYIFLSTDYYIKL